MADLRPRGSDVSWYQPPALMLWPAWLLAWGIWRAGIGQIVDKRGLEHRARMRLAKMLTGCYWALHEGVSPALQARLLLRELEGAGGDELEAWVDIEREGLTQWMVQEFLREWRRITRRPIGIYTSAQAWHAIVGRGLHEWVGELRLFVAGYPFDTAPDPERPDRPVPMDPISVALRSTPPAVLQPAIPDDWRLRNQTWTFWQHSGQGSLAGYDGFLDLDIFNGTIEQLRAAFGVAAPPARGRPLVARGSKIGIHAISPARTRALVQTAVDAGAPWPLVKSVENAGLLVEVKAISPTTLTIFRRVYHPSANGVELWSQSRMGDEAEALIAFAADNLNDAERAAIDWYEPLNEDDPPGPAGYGALGRYMVALLDVAERRGIRLALPGFNFGTPEWGEMQALVATGVFGRMKAGGHILATHEAVNPFGDEPLVAGSIPGAPAVPGAGPQAWRYRFLYHLLAARDEVVPLVVSEFYAGGAYDVGAQAAQLARFAAYDREARRDAYLLAFLGFTVDPGPEWTGQDYTPLYDSAAMAAYRLAEAGKPNETAYPLPGDQGDDELSAAQIAELREMLGAVKAGADATIASAQVTMAGADSALALLDELAETPAPWWETRQPPYKLAATGNTITIYRADGQTVVTTRAATGQWDVTERRGDLLRVLDQAEPKPDWYVHAADVQPA